MLLHAYAGVVIESFGHFVIGGSVLVGLVVFLILIIIQFVVITNGAGRVAEVAARFTLDAMPGKQMAVDGELSSQLITADQARARRREIADEADFYGAMDGASKFVRGDAIAAIVITAVNLIGGLAVGIVQHHDSFAQAGDTYSLLSVGDGLVSQIPALLMSLSTGIIVTRAASDDDLGTNVLAQLSRYRRVVRTVAVVIFVLGLLPGLPKLPFLIVGTVLFIFAGGRLPHDGADRAAAPTTPSSSCRCPSLPDAPAQLAKETGVMPLELELGMDIIDLVDPKRHGDLLERVKALRRTIAQELGIVIPPGACPRQRAPAARPTTRSGSTVSRSPRASRRRGFLLAVGKGLDRVEGEPTRDPAYGGAAKWISNEMRYRATVAGATVVERSAVVTTHLSEIVRRHAGELFSRQDVRLLLDTVKAENPVVLEEMTAAGLTLGSVQGVLRGLLEEGIPVKDLVRIIEAITDQAATPSRDPDSLLEAARLVARAADRGDVRATTAPIDVVTLEPALEQSLAAGLQLLRARPPARQLRRRSSSTSSRRSPSVVAQAEATGQAPGTRLFEQGPPRHPSTHRGPPAPHRGAWLRRRSLSNARISTIGVVHRAPNRCDLRERRWMRPRRKVHEQFGAEVSRSRRGPSAARSARAACSASSSSERFVIEVAPDDVRRHRAECDRRCQVDHATDTEAGRDRDRAHGLAGGASRGTPRDDDRHDERVVRPRARERARRRRCHGRAQRRGAERAGSGPLRRRAIRGTDERPGDECAFGAVCGALSDLERRGARRASRGSGAARGVPARPTLFRAGARTSASPSRDRNAAGATCGTWRCPRDRRRRERGHARRRDRRRSSRRRRPHRRLAPASGGRPRPRPHPRGGRRTDRRAPPRAGRKRGRRRC